MSSRIAAQLAVSTQRQLLAASAEPDQAEPLGRVTFSIFRERGQFYVVPHVVLHDRLIDMRAIAREDEIAALGQDMKEAQTSIMRYFMRLNSPDYVEIIAPLAPKAAK